MDNMDKLLKRIDDLRIGKNWTIYRLSIESGVSQSTISGWYSSNKNASPTVSSLEKVAAAFGVSLSYLIADEIADNAEVKLKVTARQMEVLDAWTKLREEEEAILYSLLKVITARHA